MKEKIKQLNERLDKIVFLAEGINNDKAVRNNIDLASPNINFVRADLELTIIREDMILRKIDEIEREFKALGVSDEKTEKKLIMNKMAILKTKEEDMKLLSFIDSSIIPRIKIAKKLWGERD